MTEPGPEGQRKVDHYLPSQELLSLTGDAQLISLVLINSKDMDEL